METLESLCREYLEIPKKTTTKEIISFYSLHKYFGKRVYKISDKDFCFDSFKVIRYKKSPQLVLCCVSSGKRIKILANTLLKNVIKRLKFFEKKIGLNFYASVVFDFKISSWFVNDYFKECPYIDISFQKMKMDFSLDPLEFYKNFCVDITSYQQAIPMKLLKGKYRVISFSKTKIRYVMRCMDMDAEKFLYVYPTENFSKILDTQKEYEIYKETYIPKDILEF